MTEPNPQDDVAELPSTRRASDGARERICLGCSSPFHSEWSGERICKRCRGTSNWRGGGMSRES